MGPPSAQLHEAMQREHCNMADSHVTFTSPNYGVSTASAIEWAFVTFRQAMGAWRRQVSNGILAGILVAQYGNFCPINKLETQV